MAQAKTSMEAQIEAKKIEMDQRFAELQDLIRSYDAYWKSLSQGVLTEPFLRLRQQEVINPALITGAYRTEKYLQEIFELANHLQKNEIKEFRDKIKKFSRTLKEKDFELTQKYWKDQLDSASKKGDIVTQTRAYYRLGTLYIKRNASEYHHEANNAILKAIQLAGTEEIKAYALRERARLLDFSPEGGEKLQLLSDACLILDRQREFKEDNEIQERARTYLDTGRAWVDLALGAEKVNAQKENAQSKAPSPKEVLAKDVKEERDLQVTDSQKKYLQAIPYFQKALSLRPGHIETITALLNAKSHCQPYENLLECIRDVNFNTQSLNGVDAFLFELGKKKKTINSLWLQAAQYGSIAILQYLEPHVNRQLEDQEGNNALHLAAKEGHAHLIPLLEKYHNTNKTNKLNLTPVFMAAKFGRVDMVFELLKRCSPTLNIKPVQGILGDVLSVTVANGQGTVFENLRQDVRQYHDLLVRIGTLYYQDPNIKESSEKRESLQAQATIAQLYRVAIDAKQIDMLKLLIQYHPEGQNILYQGQSSLHYALNAQYAKAVYVLVENGSHLDLPNSGGKVALGVAQEKRDEEMIHYISNAVQKRQAETKEILANRNSFIETVVKQFESELSQEHAELKLESNHKRLKEYLVLTLDKPKYSSFFQGEKYKQLDALSSLLIKTLLEKVKKNEITKGGGTFSKKKYDKEKLAKTLLDIVESPWFLPQVKAVEIKIKTVQEKRLSPTQDSFCDRFEKQLDEAYGYFRALASGEAVSTKDIEEQQKVNMAKTIATHLPNVPIPTTGLQLPVGTIVSGIADVVLYFRQRTRKKQAERMVNLFKAVTPYERTHFIRYTAERLADKYAEQIHHLFQGSEGVEQFADCAAARVIEYIIADDDNQIAKQPGMFSEAIRRMKSWVLSKEIPPEENNQKELYQIFLDGIVRVSSGFPKDKERLKTINHLTLQDNWCSKGIFENTGIILQHDGKIERYAHPNIDVGKYGYCQGTKWEAEKRALTLGPDPKNGRYWGEGRVWEAPEDVIAVHALPHRADPARPLLVAYSAAQATDPETSYPAAAGAGAGAKPKK